MRTRYVICASPQYLQQQSQLQQPSDVADHHCLLFPWVGFRSKWIFKDKNGLESETPVRGHTIISNAIALQQCAIAGMRLALLPHWLIEDDLHSGTLVNVFPEYDVTAKDFSTAAWLIYPSRAYIPLKVRVFIDFVKQPVGEFALSTSSA